MKSTIADARRRFEIDVMPHANTFRESEANRLLLQAEAEAKRVAGEHVAEVEQKVKAVRDEALRTLTEVRDAYDDLSRSNTSALEYSAELRRLRSRQAEAEAQIGKAEELVERTEGIEEDPVAYYDELSSRFPNTLMTDWPW